MKKKNLFAIWAAAVLAAWGIKADPNDSQQLSLDSSNTTPTPNNNPVISGSNPVIISTSQAHNIDKLMSAMTSSRTLEILNERCRNALSIIDRSGSQQGLFYQTRTALKETITQLFAKSELLPVVGIYSFSVYAQNNVAPTSNLAQLQQGIDNIQYSGGGTKQYIALQLVKNYISANPDVANPGLVIPMMGDLQDDDPTRLMELVNAIKALAPDKIVFLPFLINAGYGVNYDLAAQIAGNPANIIYYPSPLELINDTDNVAKLICGVAPSQAPTTARSQTPTIAPSRAPTTSAPSLTPTTAPTTSGPSRAPTQNVTQAFLPPVNEMPPEIPAAVIATLILIFLCCCRKKTLDVAAEAAPETTVDIEATPALTVVNPIVAREEEFVATQHNKKRDTGTTNRSEPNYHGGTFWTGGLVQHKNTDSTWGNQDGKFNPTAKQTATPPTPPVTAPPPPATAEQAKKVETEYYIGPLSFLVTGLDLAGYENTNIRRALAKTDLPVKGTIAKLRKIFTNKDTDDSHHPTSGNSL